MEVDGKEFLRNVGLEQDKAKLMEEQNKLEQKKRDSVKKTEADNEFRLDDSDSAYVDLSFGKDSSDDSTINQLEDIMLNPDATNKNKKKYIILGLALILLFIITIVVIRVISNNNQEDKVINQNKPVVSIDKDKILDKIDTKEKYESVINKKEKTIDDLQINDIEKKDIILPDPIKEKSPVNIKQTVAKKEQPRDLFGIEEPVEDIKPVVKKPVERKVTPPKEKVVKKVQKELEPPKKTVVRKKEANLPTPKETNFTKQKKGNIKGYYVQIGAFSKKPTDKFLSNISKKGYDYTVHTMDIKGKTYNKVLIGAYPTKKVASKYIDKIRKDFNNKNAYILKF
ncbi:MAG: SPOR domain-containing protein [Campylobacterota bacterium]|nr:SPOR domain-containing protein [Campylobacterota bacterium]